MFSLGGVRGDLTQVLRGVFYMQNEPYARLEHSLFNGTRASYGNGMASVQSDGLVAPAPEASRR